MIGKTIVGFFIWRMDTKKEGQTMPAIHENAGPPTVLRVRRDPVKLTALLYLKEALLKQRYEQCAQFIAVAKEFGAQEREVEELLEDARRTPR